VSDNYLEKSPDAARMGKAAEYLVAASAILATRGELNVSTSLVDDEGVDLVFHRREHSSTLAVQVKSRMSDGALARTGRVQANVREATFRPRRDLDMLFVVIDPVEGRVNDELAGAEPGVPPAGIRAERTRPPCVRSVVEGRHDTLSGGRNDAVGRQAWSG
jgi:hypothetical protein